MSVIATSPTVRLLEIEPDIGRLLSADHRQAATRELRIPSMSFEPAKGDILEQIELPGVFGALVIEGMFTQELQLGDQLGIRLLGPGDIVWRRSGPLPLVLNSIRWAAAVPSRLAMLGDEFLIAARTWPRLVSGLHLHAHQQDDRLAAQLVISQLPRVDQRILALMWLLAESWGKVTSAGTRLSLSLTHDVIGALVGARRPTVTLALRELTERGAIVRQNHGWTLLEAPIQPTRPADSLSSPVIAEQTGSDWCIKPEEAVDTLSSRTELEASYLAVRQAVSTLRERHFENAEGFAERIGRLSTSRERCAASRQRLRGERLSRQRAPSS